MFALHYTSRKAAQDRLAELDQLIAWQDEPTDEVLKQQLKAWREEAVMLDELLASDTDLFEDSSLYFDEEF